MEIQCDPHKRVKWSKDKLKLHLRIFIDAFEERREIIGERE